ncbi:DUF3267 domain-containing protein [Gracilibacillus sp. S3-1-1]|uniref:DUF3267 domain-containing protein n=1 Tax=Gracilibacillus pellucidus TaxID=3095368 RepID=A0ACC6M7H6_9BACI|nr:DUF3267 domain-containing protein [Gracilibacillus sp. S3-1-1]MDX8046777.1 DUF3267 domain-containing protein [Gracilibacillus sp. S3-1-1]
MDLKLIEEINILVNRKLIVWLNVWAVVIFLVLLAGSLFLPIEGTVAFTLVNLLLFFISLMVIIMLHEWIHGIFFKMFAPKSKVKYGFKSGMLYAANPGAKYNKKQFTLIAIMPFVLITLLTCVLFSFPVNKIALYLLFAIHTSGCVGDFYYCYKLWKNRKRSVLIEDTTVGISIFEVSNENNAT